MKTKPIYLLKEKLSGYIYLPTVLMMLACLLTSINQIQAQTWTEVQKISASDRAGGDLFGCDVSISGDYAIVGAYQVFDDETGQNTNLLNRAGAAYIFERDNDGNWQEVQKLVAADRDTFDLFGYHVAISGTYAIVSAPFEHHDVSGNNWLNESGSAYIFERDNNGVWQEVQKIVASDRGAGDNFGKGIAISGNYIIVSSEDDNEDANGGNTLSNAGSAYIFERDGNGNWQQVQKIVASDRAVEDKFGISVSISGSYAIVGAHREDEDARGRKTKTNAGSAYIFERDGNGNWNQVDKIVASDRNASDFFGWRVSISGDKAIVGAYQEDENASGGSSMNSSGSAYIFERNSRGDWKQSQKIVASDRTAPDQFGHRVGISGNRAIVSTVREAHDASGNNYLNSAGSAYIFELNGGVWQEIDKIVASDREELDRFGSGVSISGDFAIVGAYYEDEDTSGNNSKSIAGSAYIFGKSNFDPCDQSTLTAEAGPDQSTYFGYAPEECADLSGSASGGTPSYSYAWNGQPGSADKTVCPSSTTVYTLTVTDSDGCSATDNLTVHVTNVKCKGKKVTICHDGVTQCVSSSQVASHLAHGDYLGDCSGGGGSSMEIINSEKDVKVYPNPTDDLLNIEFNDIENVKSVSIFDLSGKEIQRVNRFESSLIEMDVRSLSDGVYIISVRHTDGTKQNQKVVIY
jgi:hypothetical protein